MSEDGRHLHGMRPRRLKACRTCRRQKMRCEGSSDAPCPRCVNAGVECVFDLVERREQPDGTSGVAQKRKLDMLQEEIQTLKDQMHEIVQMAQKPRPNSPNTPGVPRTSSLPVDRSPEPLIVTTSTIVGETCDDVEDSIQHRQQQGWQYGDPPTDNHGAQGDLPNRGEAQGVETPDDSQKNPSASHVAQSKYMDQITWSAPLSAVHALTPPFSTTSEGFCNVQSFSSIDERLGSSSMVLSSNDTGGTMFPPKNDCISHIFEDESHARNILSLYFGGGNPFIPMFDPTADTFDSLRRRSPFCLITILYVGLSQNYESLVPHIGDTHTGLKDIAYKEARRLASESLFDNPAALESVQAMIMLAAYSEKVWFAIGHALQMAADLGLDTAMDRLNEQKSTSPSESYQLLRQARTWLVLHHLERELAFGTARQPRMPLINPAALKKYLSHPSMTSYDMRYSSIIEIVQLRGTWLSQISSTGFDAVSHVSWVGSMERRIEAWYQYWDAQLEGRGVDDSCFQRNSMRILKSYTTINLYCLVLGKIQEDTQQPLRPQVNELMRRTANVTMELLRFISEDESYRWHFKWAPAYSALMLTFLAMFALQICRKWPQLVNKANLRVRISSVILMLETYPYNNSLAYQVKQMMTQSFLTQDVNTEAPTGSSADGAMGKDAVENEQIFNPSDPDVLDCEDLDWFLASGYLENWSFLEQSTSSFMPS